MDERLIDYFPAVSASAYTCVRVCIYSPLWLSPNAGWEWDGFGGGGGGGGEFLFVTRPAPDKRNHFNREERPFLSFGQRTETK